MDVKAGMGECVVCNDVTYHVNGECQRCINREIDSDRIVINVPFCVIDECENNGTSIDTMLDHVFKEQKERIILAYNQYKDTLKG